MFLLPQNLGNVCILFAVSPCPGCESKDLSCGVLIVLLLVSSVVRVSRLDTAREHAGNRTGSPWERFPSWL